MSVKCSQHATYLISNCFIFRLISFINKIALSYLGHHPVIQSSSNRSTNERSNYVHPEPVPRTRDGNSAPPSGCREYPRTQHLSRVQASLSEWCVETDEDGYGEPDQYGDGGLVLPVDPADAAVARVGETEYHEDQDPRRPGLDSHGLDGGDDVIVRPVVQLVRGIREVSAEDGGSDEGVVLPPNDAAL